jgi:hypothetical protein
MLLGIDAQQVERLLRRERRQWTIQFIALVARFVLAFGIYG